MKVSILIPVYNSETFLAATITSALNQSWPDKEIIIVDDGSTDRSLSIAQSFASSTVRVFKQPNGGACKARNRAFAESKGDYIQYLDADDLLSPDKIKNQLALVSAHETDTVLSCTWIRFYDDEDLTNPDVPKRLLDRDWNNPLDWLTQAWLGNGMAQTSTWLSPRRLIEQAGTWNENLSINQDGEFFCRVLLQAKSIKYSRSSFIYYRSGRINSISQKITERKANDLLYSYTLYEEHIRKKNTGIDLAKPIARNYMSFIYTYYDQFPSLAKKAQQRLDSLDANHVMVGGKYFIWFSKVLGFNNALRMRSLFRRLGTRSV